MRRLAGSEGAEDVVQKLWLKVQRVRNDAPIRDERAYLRRLAHNAAVDHVQADWRQARVAERAEALLWGVDYELGPERIVESRETLERMRGDRFPARTHAHHTAADALRHPQLYHQVPSARTSS